jgi:hypothetical protein
MVEPLHGEGEAGETVAAEAALGAAAVPWKTQ